MIITLKGKSDPVSEFHVFSHVLSFVVLFFHVNSLAVSSSLLEMSADVDVSHLSSIMEPDGTSPVKLQETNKNIWKTQQQCLITEIPTCWLEILHAACWEFWHRWTTFLMYHYAEHGITSGGCHSLHHGYKHKIPGHECLVISFGVVIHKK